MRKRTTFESIEGKIRYRVMNEDIVQINLNSIIKQISKIEGLSYEPVNGFFLLSFIHKNKISSNVYKIRIGTDYVNLKSNVVSGRNTGIDNIEIIKNQKNAFDAVKPDRWTNQAFLQYYGVTYAKKYNTVSVEASVHNKNAQGDRSPISRIKFLINKFHILGHSRASVRDYINWAFDHKSKRFTLSIGFISSDLCIQEWINLKGNRDDKKKKTVRKWD